MNIKNSSLKTNKITNYSKFANQIIAEINYARENPFEYSVIIKKLIDKTFENTIYYEGTQTYLREGIELLEEAVQFLEIIDPLPQFINCEGLTNSSDKLLNNIVLHDGINFNDNKNFYEIEKRIKSYGAVYGETEELIDYGITDPILLVISFILSDGDEERKERNILFSDRLKYIGISSGLLPSENICTVLDFAEYFYNPGEYIPEKVIKLFEKKDNNILKRKNSASLYKEKHDKFNNNLLIYKNDSKLNKYESNEDDQLSEDVEKIEYFKRKFRDVNGSIRKIEKKIIHYYDGSTDTIIS